MLQFAVPIARRCSISAAMEPSALTVWHNDKCPVCKAGIDWQRHKMRPLVETGEIAFRDINFEPDALKPFGVAIDDVRRRLHAVTADGRLLIGADVAIAIWRKTPGDEWLATIFGAPGVIHLTRYAYDRFADGLFVWNKRAGRW